MDSNNKYKDLWQQATREIESSNRLTNDIIIKSIRKKSNGILEQFLREKRTGMFALAIIPIIGFVEFYNYGINVWSILLVTVFHVAAIWAIIDTRRRLKRLSDINESSDLRTNLTEKIQILTRFFSQNKVYGPLIGLVIIFFAFLHMKYIDLGTINFSLKEVIYMFFFAIIYSAFVIGLIHFQSQRYIRPLKECLNNLEENYPAFDVKKPSFSLVLILLIIIIIGLVFSIISMLK